MDNFNLKKFLVENKLTPNSKILNEGVGTAIDYEKLKQILLLASKTKPENYDGALYEKSDIKNTLKYIMVLEKGVKKNNPNVFDKLEDQELATFEGSVYLDDAQSSRWSEFELAISVVSDVASEYDLDDAASALSDLAQAIDSFQLQNNTNNI